LLAGVEVGRVDPAANAVFAAGGADDAEVSDHERREGHCLAHRRIGNLALPDLLAGRAIERDQAAVESGGNDLVLPKRHATIVDAAAGDVARPDAIDLRIELPAEYAFLAARHVDRIHRAPAVGNVHRAIVDQWCGFEIAVQMLYAGFEAAEPDGEG